MSLHACRVSVVTVDAVGNPTTFRRDLILPFPPSVAGPELGFSSPMHHWSGEIISAVYDNDKGQFHVELQDWEGISPEEAQRELGPEWVRLPRAA